jgi:GDP-L-fucose synthase
MQNALIIGHTGFLGRHFVKRASKIMRLTEINSKNCNLLTNEIFKYDKIKYDYIFYFAVKTEAGGYCQSHPGEQFIINQKMNTRVLDYWHLIQPQAKFITFGSSCSYSDYSKKSEENYLIGSCETGYEVYGMIKRMLLIGLRAFAKEFHMKYLFFVPSCLYGTDYKKGDKHFIYDINRKLCDAKFKNAAAPVLWGDGHQRRELIYVEDAVEIIIDLLDRENEIINLSTGKDYSIREYAMFICNIIDYDFDNIDFDLTKFVGAKEKKLIVDKIKHYTFTSPNEGLEKICEFYIDNHMETNEDYLD